MGVTLCVHGGRGSGCYICKREAEEARRSEIAKATPEVRNLVRLILSEIAANIRERERYVDTYYGSEHERAATGSYNDAISAIADAIETEASKLIIEEP